MYAASVNSDVRTGAGRQTVPKRRLRRSGVTGSDRTYDVSHDGRRFLMIKMESGPTATASSIVVVSARFMLFALSRLRTRIGHASRTSIGTARKANACRLRSAILKRASKSRATRANRQPRYTLQQYATLCDLL